MPCCNVTECTKYSGNVEIGYYGQWLDDTDSFCD